MKTSRLLGAICAMIFSFISLPSHAALVPELGGQVIYDTDLNITWVADGNLVLTNQFGLTLSNTLFDDTPNTVGSGGAMTWDNAQAWIVGMNNANYLGFNDWRLPNTPELDPSVTVMVIIALAVRWATCSITSLARQHIQTYRHRVIRRN